MDVKCFQNKSSPGTLLTSEGERGALSKLKESVLDLGKKCDDYIQLWVKFSLKMLVYEGI